MLYANEPARIYTGHADQPYQGQHCYQYMMGLTEQCPFCPMRQMNGTACQETEVDNGHEIYAVKTKIIKWNGKKVFIEYAWNITKIRRSQRIFENQMQTLISSIPEAQGIFHLDLTSDMCLSINGASKNVEAMEQRTPVDVLIRQIASFVPDKKGQEEFFTFFCRSALLTAYAKGNAEISKKTESYFDDGTIRSACITARFFMNPSTDHLECVLYGMDISAGKEERIRYEKHLTEQFQIFTALSRDYLNIFLIDGEQNMAEILKLDGYVTTGLEKKKDAVYPYEATCSQYISERVHPDDRDMMREAMQLKRVLQELKERDEYTGSYRTLVDGETHYYQFKYMRMENKKHIIAGFQNIDAIIAKEREVQEALETALKAEEQSNRAKTVFLNSMSHDIRTPLNAIIGCAALAENHMDDPAAVAWYLSKITTAGNELLALVNDILDMSHIESGSVELELLPVYLPKLMEELQNILQESIEEKQLQFRIEMEDMVHPEVMADRLRLNQIFLNILSNSVKFTKQGGSILFSVRERTDAPEGFGSYDFRIKDNGLGMDSSFVEHIFETFSREQTVTVSGIQGSGLGMAIVKNIVDLLGGQISVKSKKGYGTDILVTLQFPVCSTPVIEKKKSGQPADFTGKKILLVEDNELNREIALELLGELGFIIDTAEDGTIAVEKMLHAEPDQYDLILMDIQMPLMDGYEATRQIRNISDKRKASIPIVAMTANAFEEDRQKALEAGMNGHIAKPIDMEKMIETLKSFLPIASCDGRRELA